MKCVGKNKTKVEHENTIASLVRNVQDIFKDFLTMCTVPVYGVDKYLAIKRISRQIKINFQSGASFFLILSPHMEGKVL